MCESGLRPCSVGIRKTNEKNIAFMSRQRKTRARSQSTFYARWSACDPLKILISHIRFLLFFFSSFKRLKKISFNISLKRWQSALFMAQWVKSLLMISKNSLVEDRSCDAFHSRFHNENNWRSIHQKQIQEETPSWNMISRSRYGRCESKKNF